MSLINGIFLRYFRPNIAAAHHHTSHSQFLRNQDPCLVSLLMTILTSSLLSPEDDATDEDFLLPPNIQRHSHTTPTSNDQTIAVFPRVLLLVRVSVTRSLAEPQNPFGGGEAAGVLIEAFSVVNSLA